MDNLTKRERPRYLTVVDCPESVQRWVDAFVASAVDRASSAWPHPHPQLPPCTITLPTLWRCIEETFTVDGQPWRILEQGFPRLDGFLPPVGTNEHRAPGKDAHNLLHSLFGDFH